MLEKLARHTVACHDCDLIISDWQLDFVVWIRDNHRNKGHKAWVESMPEEKFRRLLAAQTIQLQGQ